MRVVKDTLATLEPFAPKKRQHQWSEQNVSENPAGQTSIPRLLILPSFIANYFQGSSSTFVRDVADWMHKAFDPNGAVYQLMVFMLVYVWFRATFPRFRFDQLMELGWKWMIPLALANIVVTGVVVLLGQSLNFQGEVVLSIAGAAIVGYTLYNLRPRAKVVHASRVSEV